MMQVELQLHGIIVKILILFFNVTAQIILSLHKNLICIYESVTVFI